MHPQISQRWIGTLSSMWRSLCLKICLYKLHRPLLSAHIQTPTITKNTQNRPVPTCQRRRLAVIGRPTLLRQVSVPVPNAWNAEQLKGDMFPVKSPMPTETSQCQQFLYQVTATSATIVPLKQVHNPNMTNIENKKHTFSVVAILQKKQSWKNFLFPFLCFLLIYHNRHIFLCKSFVGKKTANTKTETSIRSSLVTSKDKLPIKSLKNQRRVAKSNKQWLKTTNKSGILVEK